MNDELLKEIEENISEIISGNILIPSQGPGIASMVMERLECKGLLNGDSSSVTGSVFAFNDMIWTQDQLENNEFTKTNSQYYLRAPCGRNLILGKEWLDNFDHLTVFSHIVNVLKKRRENGEAQ